MKPISPTLSPPQLPYRTRPAGLSACAALALAIATFARPAPAHAGEPPTDASLVEVLVTYQEHDPLMPWQKREPGLRRGYGVFVNHSRVITTESLVRNHELIELRRPRTGEKIPAKVEMSDPQANLACLSVRAGRLLRDVLPIPLAESVDRAARVSIVQFDDTRQIQRGDARTYQVSIASLPRAPYATLSFSLLTDFNVNGEGAPVVQSNALAGLMMSYNWNTRIGNMLPYCLIRRFLDNVDAPPYAGFASAGFLWNELVDPAKRRFLGVEESEGGVQVLAMVPGSGAAESLEPNDVILEWDGRPIDNLGFYQDPEFGRLAFSYLIAGYRKPGDQVPARIVRGRKPLTVHVRLSRLSDAAMLVPENAAGEKPDYLVEGGLVLRELDAAYLRAHGNEWQQRTDSRLVYDYLTRRYRPERPGDRIVILTGILPDRINTSYQRFNEEVVTHVNGKPIRNIGDVFDIVRADGSVQRLTLQGVGVDLVLDKAELPAANERLSRLYRIPSLRFRRGDSPADSAMP